MRSFAVLVALSLVAGCSAAAEPVKTAKPKPVSVQTVTVTTRSLPGQLRLTGTLRGSQDSDLAANATGRVLQTYVERGTVVKKGAVLARLDVRSALRSAEEASASAQNAQAQAELAQEECKRAEELFQKGALSRQEYDQTASRCRTSALSVTAAKARADLATQTVGDASIRAPFDGVVTERFIDVGEYVRPDTAVVHLVSLQPLRLEVTVPEAYLPMLQVGAPVRFNVIAYGDRVFEGTLRYIGAAVRAETRDAIVEAEVPNVDGLLRPGMFASIELRGKERELPVVPKDALVAHDEQTHVFVVSENRAEERVVETGPEIEEVTTVLRGLRAGEKVVLRPSGKLTNGAEVR